MSLKDFRTKIDDIDSRIVNLLNERAALTLSIGQDKKARNKGIYAPEREKEVLERLRQLNAGPLTDEALGAIYREVMSAALSMEKDIRVAVLGQQGSFTYQAAFEKFGSQLQYDSCNSIHEVFQMVEQDDCDYGVVPVENSVEGAVTHTFDLLVDSDLRICAQTLLPISHALMSVTGEMKAIRRIISHPQIFGQCRNWIQGHLPQAAQITVDSSTEAAEAVTKVKSGESAAIASALAAKSYKLKIIREDIQDVSHNTTRFLILAKADVPPTGKDRTSIVFSIKDRIGALHAMLEPFEKNKINLTKIESRPSKKRAWDYFFFVDFEGHRDEARAKRALDELEGMCKFLKVLGSYPVIDG